MEVKAVAKYVRISPQKVRKLIDGVKGKPVEEGLEYAQIYAAEGSINR